MPIDPRILEAFKKKGYKMERGDGDIEWQFIAGIPSADKANHASWHWNLSVMKEAGEPIKETIVAAKRIYIPESQKEYVLFTYQIQGQHHDGSALTETWKEKGRYELPTWKRFFDGKKNRWVESDEVRGSKTIYEYEWKGPKTQVVNLEGKMVPMTSLFNETTRYLIVADNGTKLKVTQEDFMQLPRAELIAKYNANPQVAAFDKFTQALSQAESLKKG